jgi:hypothetical protein
MGPSQGLGDALAALDSNLDHLPGIGILVSQDRQRRCLLSRRFVGAAVLSDTERQWQTTTDDSRRDTDVSKVPHAS